MSYNNNYNSNRNYNNDYNQNYNNYDNYDNYQNYDNYNNQNGQYYQQQDQYDEYYAPNYNQNRYRGRGRGRRGRGGGGNYHQHQHQQKRQYGSQQQRQQQQQGSGIEYPQNVDELLRNIGKTNRNDIIEIDGSTLEGGGQILRNGMTFAALLMQPIHIVKIRGKRSRPGLASQHLHGVLLAQKIYGGYLSGAYLRSMEILYIPENHRSNKRDFFADTETAGSICLLLQSSLPLLFTMPDKCSIVLRGGTNASFAPQIDYFSLLVQPMLEKLFGLKMSIAVNSRGFYPRGGGEVRVTTEPVASRMIVESEKKDNNNNNNDNSNQNNNPNVKDINYNNSNNNNSGGLGNEEDDKDKVVNMHNIFSAFSLEDNNNNNDNSNDTKQDEKNDENEKQQHGNKGNKGNKHKGKKQKVERRVLPGINMCKRGNLVSISGIVILGGDNLEMSIGDEIRNGILAQLSTNNEFKRLIDQDANYNYNYNYTQRGQNQNQNQNRRLINIRVSREWSQSYGTACVVVAQTDKGCMIGGSGLGDANPPSQQGQGGRNNRRGRNRNNKNIDYRQVGMNAAKELLTDWEYGPNACTDRHFQDQLIVFMALAKGKSKFKTCNLELHTETAIYFAELLTGAKFQVQKQNDGVLIECQGVGLVGTE